MPIGIYQRLSAEQRFWAKVNKTEGCWIWTAAKDTSSYGRFSVNDRLICAHRFAYELLISPIPKGLTLDHLCRNPACVNPEHLEPVTNKVNTLRGVGLSAREARQTHCKYGHPFDLFNTGWEKTGRRCKECHRNWEREWRRHTKHGECNP